MIPRCVFEIIILRDDVASKWNRIDLWVAKLAKSVG